MPLDEPAWWYRAPRSPLIGILRPVSAVYGWVAERRFRVTQPYRAALPVICVGNLTAGGTGKTPLAMLIARELSGMGERPAILTRGHGGREAGPHWVDARTDGAYEVGDEALLLADAAPTMVARDRPAGVRAIIATSPPVSVIVMDDGLQNPTLAKDLSIAVVDGSRGIGNGEVVPAGPLRAPLLRQIARVDLIVMNYPPSQRGTARPEDPDWLQRHFAGPVLRATPVPSGDAGWVRGARTVAFAGIGNPQRFFDLLAELGADVAARVSLPDHHAFTEADAERILRLARTHRAQLVTTEKDLVRLKGVAGARGELRQATRALGIRLFLNEGDGARLASLIRAILQRRRTVR